MKILQIDIDTDWGWNTLMHYKKANKKGFFLIGLEVESRLFLVLSNGTEGIENVPFLIENALISYWKCTQVHF